MSQARGAMQRNRAPRGGHLVVSACDGHGTHRTFAASLVAVMILFIYYCRTDEEKSLDFYPLRDYHYTGGKIPATFNSLVQVL